MPEVDCDAVAAAVDCTALTDGDLARRVATAMEDAAAAEAELCVRFARRVRLYGLRHLRSAQAADDLAQRAMLVMLEKLRGGDVREPERIESFVLGVARMLAREERRGRPGELSLSADGEQSSPHEMAPVDPFASARLARCLTTLAERERAVVVLTYYGEASSRDVAVTMGLAEGHIRVIRHRAIAKLRECMNGPGVDGVDEALRPEMAS